MSDTWDEIQAIKSKQISLKERIAARKKQIAELNSSAASSDTSAANLINDFQTASPLAAERGFAGIISTSNTSSPLTGLTVASDDHLLSTSICVANKHQPIKNENLREIEKMLLTQLIDISLNLPVNAEALYQSLKKNTQDVEVSLSNIENLIQKYSVQSLITLSSELNTESTVIETVDHKKLTALYELELKNVGIEPSSKDVLKKNLKRKLEENEEANAKMNKANKKTESSKSDQVIESLLSMQSAKERENKKLTEDILQLLSKPTTKERLLTERFRSQGGRQVREFCSFGTREECQKSSNHSCAKLHFKKIIHKHTDETLGDCSFLNTCFHMDTCKYVHYQIDYSDADNSEVAKPKPSTASQNQTPAPASSRIWSDMSGVSKYDDSSTILFPPQWIQCDLRSYDMSVLGKFAVVMADPPWDIHMELPYGTMSDDEMRKLNVPVLQDDGYIFLWVTGRAMELGRECLTLWGYERVDELIWVKTNQLQRIIRTGRTGHWLNHGKEHCLVGVKGNLKGVNRGLDCDVIVSEVRATSHKPDEIYGIIERLSPGTRKIELFGRPHNVQPNWITLGNQVDGVKLIDPEVVRAFRLRYPEGNPTK